MFVLHRLPKMSPASQKRLMTGSTVVAACIAAACSATPADGSSHTASPSIAQADTSQQLQPSGASGLAAIEALIGDAACRTSQDCRVIGIGARACGGPEAYRAWSSWRTPEAQLQKLVLDDAQFRRRQLDSLGMASTCAILTTPGVACGPRGAASSPATGHGTCTLQPVASGI